MKLSMKKVFLALVVFACLVLFMSYIYSGNKLSQMEEKAVYFSHDEYTITIDGNTYMLLSEETAYFPYDEYTTITVDGNTYMLLSEEAKNELEQAAELRREWEENRDGWREKWIQTEYESAERIIRDSEEISGKVTIPAQKRTMPIEAQRQPEQILASIADEMVLVNGGTFMMGCAPEQESDCWTAEKPARKTVIRNDFYIGKYEVTQAQWKAVMGKDSNPSAFKGDDLPVEMVSWEDVQVFINKLNVATGKNYRLPTEAEWEYAARGGNKSNGYKYSGSDDLDEVAWHRGNGMSRTHPVGTKKANELGIYDMTGNVYEWVYDRFYASGLPYFPYSSRVVRGGGFIDMPSNVSRFRVSSRNGSSPWYPFIYTGFRLAHSSE